MTIPSLSHPSERRRIAYALGEGRAGERARTARHLLTCEGCRADVDAISSLQAGARALPASPAPEAVLDLVLADLASGRRSPEAVDWPVRRRAGIRWLAAAAVIAALGVTLATRYRGAHQALASPPLDLLAAFSPTLAFAQEKDQGEATPLDRALIAQLASTRESYRMHWWYDGEWHSEFTTEEQITVPGEGPISIVRIVPRPRRELRDSLLLDRRTLSPMLQVIRRGSWRIVDSVAGGVLTRSYPMREGSGPIEIRIQSRALPPMLANKHFLLAPDLALALYLRAVPLARDARVTFVGPATTWSGADTAAISTRAITMRVVGEDLVSVPGGRFKAWRLEVEPTPTDVRQLVWVSTDSRQVVKTERSYRGKPLMRMELERSQRP